MRRVATRGLLYVTATFFALFAALPFAWMILTVFKQNTDLYDPNRNPFLYNDRRRWATSPTSSSGRSTPPSPATR